MLVYSSFSPLEQFDIIPLFNLTFSFFDFTITNTTSMSFFINSFATIIFLSLLKKNQKTFYIIPSNAQIIFETIYNLILSTLITNIGSKDGKPFLPVLYSVFLFIISSNLLGLIPYSFTLTSHMITTIFLSLFFFIGVNIICIRTHKFIFFSTFFPKNTSFALDPRFSVQKRLKMVKSKTNAPLLMLIDTKDQIKFISAGYAIGNIDLIIQSMQAESLCLKNCTK